MVGFAPKISKSCLKEHHGKKFENFLFWNDDKLPWLPCKFSYIFTWQFWYILWVFYYERSLKFTISSHKQMISKFTLFSGTSWRISQFLFAIEWRNYFPCSPIKIFMIFSCDWLTIFRIFCSDWLTNFAMFHRDCWTNLMIFFQWLIDEFRNVFLRLFDKFCYFFSNQLKNFMVSSCDSLRKFTTFSLLLTDKFHIFSWQIG